MRKNSVALIAAVMISAGSAGILSGCAEIPFVGTAKPDFSAGYTMSAEITCGKLEAAADIAYIGENDWEFTFTEPKTLAGMKLLLNEEGLSGKLGSLSFSVDDSEEYTLLPKIIARAVDTLSKLPAEKRNINGSDGVITLETEFGGKPVTVTADSNGGLISLKCPYYSLSASFSNRQKITPAPPEDDTEENSEEPTITITPV